MVGRFQGQRYQGDSGEYVGFDVDGTSTLGWYSGMPNDSKVFHGTPGISTDRGKTPKKEKASWGCRERYAAWRVPSKKATGKTPIVGQS